MKTRKNYFRILCSMLFCFTLGAVGCSSSGDSGGSGGSGGGSDPGDIPPGSFLVTFDAGGGTMTSPTTQVVKTGEKVTAPRMPTYEGYIFKGWYLEPNYVGARTPFDFDSPITSTTTIYAGWDIDREYFDGGGSGGGGGGDPTTQRTYTCNSLPSWIQDDGCVIFAWAWPQGSSGAWYSLTIVGSSATFKTDQDMAGFLLARCVAGTTQPNWSITSGNASGRIYNQTENIDCSAGNYTYNCASWKDYPSNS